MCAVRGASGTARGMLARCSRLSRTSALAVLFAVSRNEQRADIKYFLHHGAISCRNCS